MYPLAGKVGPFKLKMYRGDRASNTRLTIDFASDPGDYGVGEYWTNSKDHAEFYGNVRSEIIELDDVYHIPSDELKRLIEEYRTCKMEDGHEKRKDNSLRLTEMFKSKGYKAVLTIGYEDLSSMGLCIFDPY